MKSKLMIAFLAFCATHCRAQQTFSATDSSSSRQIELPAALIRSVKVDLLSDKANSVIGSSEIKKQNVFHDLPYMLNGLSSVVVTSDAGAGTGYTGIRIRGADLTRINVTMNGVPVNDAESQNTFFVDMPDMLSSTKEIQVSKGVGTSKSGTGNFGAGIAINNLDADQTTPFLSFQTDAGSFNTQKAVLKIGTGLLYNRFNATIRLSGLKSDGYIQRSSSDLKGMQITAKYQLHPMHQIVVNYLNGHEKTGQAWNGVSQDSLQTNRRFNELGMRRDGTFYDNQTDNYGQQYYQLFYTATLPKNWQTGATLYYTKGRGYYEEFKLDQAYQNYNLPNVIQGNDTITQTDLIRQLWLDNDFYGARLFLNYLTKKLDAGVYFNVNRYDGRHFGDVIWAQQAIRDGYRWYDLDARKQELNVYGMVDYRFAAGWSFFSDLQVRKVDYQINGFRNNPQIRHDLDFLFFNPKMTLRHKNNRHQLSLVAGLAQKEPNRDDVEAGINELPKPERLFNTEFSYYRLLSNQVSVHLTGFLMYYKDQLVLTGKINDVGAYTRSNVPESYRLGLEMDIAWKPGLKWVEAKANLALSQNRIVSFTEYIDDYDQGGQLSNVYRQSPISFSPAVIGFAQISILPFQQFQSWFNRFSIDWMQKYVGEQFLDNTGNQSRMIDAYMVSDCMLRLPFRVYTKGQMNLRFGINNVFNTLYEANGYTFSYRLNNTLTTQNYFFPQAGRRWMFGFGIEF